MASACVAPTTEGTDAVANDSTTKGGNKRGQSSKRGRVISSKGKSDCSKEPTYKTVNLRCTGCENDASGQGWQALDISFSEEQGSLIAGYSTMAQCQGEIGQIESAFECDNCDCD